MNDAVLARLFPYALAFALSHRVAQTLLLAEALACVEEAVQVCFVCARSQEWKARMYSVFCVHQHRRDRTRRPHNNAVMSTGSARDHNLCRAHVGRGHHAAVVESQGGACAG